MAVPIGIDELVATQVVVPRMTRIYTLSDPRDGAVRYVGKTCMSLRKRLRDHIREADSGRWRSHSARWIRSLSALGLAPLMQQIDTAHGDAWVEIETYHIAKYRADGASLTNITAGGEGMMGWNPSPETRAKMSAAKKGKRLGIPPSPQTIAALRLANTGKVIPDKQKAAQSAKMTGRKASAETKAKMSVTRKGRPSGPMSLETRAKLSLAAIARFSDPAERERTRVTTIAQFADPAARLRASATTKAQWEDTDFRDRVTEAVIKRNSCPIYCAEVGAKISAAHARRRINKAKAAQEASLARIDDLFSPAPVVADH